VLVQALAVVLVGVLSAGAAFASVITGPVLNSNVSGYNYTGVGFTASVNATLTSFTFQNQGLADTVILVDSLGNILDSVGTLAGNPSNTISVAWALIPGSIICSKARTIMDATSVGGRVRHPMLKLH
jgi:hypothetical protein